MLFLFALLPSLGFSQVDFIWVDSIDGDFSFTEEWAYQEGVYVNQWGQLSCDGLCPMEIDRMKDDQGRIYDDSLTAFYAVVDTTHLYFTHKGEVRTFEYGDCNYASAKLLNDQIHIQTDVGIATHTSLHIVFDPNDSFEDQKFKVYLIYNSIRNVKPVVFQALSGTIAISSRKFEQGMIKLNFDLEFEEVSNNPEFKQTWKGKILTTLE